MEFFFLSNDAKTTTKKTGDIFTHFQWRNWGLKYEQQLNLLVCYKECTRKTKQSLEEEEKIASIQSLLMDLCAYTMHILNLSNKSLINGNELFIREFPIEFLNCIMWRQCECDSQHSDKLLICAS